MIVPAETTREVQVEIWCCEMSHLDFSQNQNVQVHILKDVIEIYFKTLEDVYDKLLNQILDYKGHAQYNEILIFKTGVEKDFKNIKKIPKSRCL